MTPEITPAAEAALAAVMADPLLGLLDWSRRYSRGADLLVGSLGAVDVRLYVHRADRPYPYRAIMPDGGGRNIKSLADALLWLLAGVQSLLYGCRAVDPVVTQLVAEGARLRAERDEARAEVESLRAALEPLALAHAAACHDTASATAEAATAYARGWRGCREAAESAARRCCAHVAAREIQALTPPTTPPPQEATDA